MNKICNCKNCEQGRTFRKYKKDLPDEIVNLINELFEENCQIGEDLRYSKVGLQDMRRGYV